MCARLCGGAVIESRAAHPECVLNPTLSYCFSGGTVMQVLFSALIGAMALGQVRACTLLSAREQAQPPKRRPRASLALTAPPSHLPVRTPLQAVPNLTAIGAAQGAAARIFEVIDRCPPIDVDSDAGLKPDPATVTGRIEFRGVTFAYASRPDQPVLRDFSLVLEPGTTVALCGPSGSGKSTLMGLIMRFYDPQAGAYASAVGQPLLPAACCCCCCCTRTALDWQTGFAQR